MIYLITKTNSNTHLQELKQYNMDKPLIAGTQCDTCTSSQQDGVKSLSTQVFVQFTIII